MSLSPGSRLGHCDVTALIGEGGMGQVYQATDTKLNRQVALKTLPEAFATDPDRLARFQREAQVLASLNHPNIAQIHGLEEADGVRALVLELVEGPTLADRISRGPIPVDEALPIAKQIAEALEAAHEAGVIHRDLKPANVKVKDDGTVKVLDFGLAKALDPTPEGDPSQSPTLTAAATKMGVIMGTAAYMSPEQARGKTVDRRADVWAFGAVLYEMLTGKKAFDGRDASETLGGVLRDGTGEADQLTEGTDNKVPHAITADGKTVVFRSGGDLHTLSLDGEPTASPLIETEFTEHRPRLSPDGRWIAYQTDESGQWEVLVRPFPDVEGGRWRISPDGGHSPLWAPNGRELFYMSDVSMWSASVDTEPIFSPHNAEMIFPETYAIGGVSGTGWLFDIAPDGERFLARKPGAATTTVDTIAPELILVQNWFDELQRLVPTQ